MVSRRTPWRGELARVRISDKVKTALTDDSVALTACSAFAALDTRRAAEVMGCQGTDESRCSAHASLLGAAGLYSELYGVGLGPPT